MAVYSFPGGIKLPEKKSNSMKKCRIRALPMSKRLVLPLHAFGGRLCTPLVKVGSPVLSGMKIASDESGSYLLHSPVSGRVEAILSPERDNAPAIVLENDFARRRDGRLSPFGKSLMKAAPEEMLAVIREAGIPLFSEGGASLYDRLTEIYGKAKTVIVNGIRREPWITGGYRLLIENPGAVIGGLKILLKLLSVRSALLALEETCREAARAVAGIAFDPALLKTVFLRSKYPGWQEKPLVYAATGRALPKGKKAVDGGILLIDPETLAAVYKAFVDGLPVLRRILTIHGENVIPGNYFVPLGISLLSIADFLKIEKETPPAVLGEYAAVLDGRMNGDRRPLKDLFVTKETAAVYLQKKEDAHFPEGECVHCGRCLRVCPAGLPPIMVYRAIAAGNPGEALRYNGGECIGCGCCSRICPAGVFLAERIFPWKTALDGEFSKNARPDKKAASPAETALPKEKEDTE